MRLKSQQEKEQKERVEQKKVLICEFCGQEFPYKEICDEYTCYTENWCCDLCKILWFYKDDRRDELKTKEFVEEYIQNQKQEFIKDFIEKVKEEIK